MDSVVGRSRAIAGVVMMLLLLAITIPETAEAGSRPKIIPLPDGFQPEGIATERGADFFTGSLVDGAIFKGSLRSGKGDIFVPGM
ncbi:MAG TPA: superoxide dismutase, partial [Actinomycetota bacterium]|nr:superoxide dismutase [Actinomycetota bacterium]